jgi:hypothetical protein
VPEKLDPSNLRAAWWTLRALRITRSRLREGAIEAISMPEPPRVSPDAVRGVLGLLRRVDHTCLERSLVLQRWHTAQGQPADIVVGVTSPQGGFTAHAWLDGDPDGNAFAELLRLPAR